MLYRLIDIEYWQHNHNAFPKRIVPHVSTGLTIGKSYTSDEFTQAERKLGNMLTSQGWSAVFMNPLYQIGNKGETTLTVDLYPSVEKIKEIIPQKEVLDEKWYKDILSNLFNHRTRFNAIVKIGGNVSMTRENGVFFSNDPILQEHERNVAKIIHDGSLQQNVLTLAIAGEEHMARALQWVQKDGSFLSKIVGTLKNENISSNAVNILMRQLIPCFDALSNENKKIIVAISADILKKHPANVRNKFLSLLCEFDKMFLQELPKSVRDFLTILSETKQLNIALPAKEILQK